MLQCADGSYYIGSHRGFEPSKRESEHNQGFDKHAYTFTRRPVELVYSEPFERFDEMVAYERRLKGWSRAKKEALIRGDRNALFDLSRRGGKPSLVSHPSRRGHGAAPQDEEVKGCDIESPHPEERIEDARREGWAACDEGEA
jgi:putative endonuclease